MEDISSKSKRQKLDIEVESKTSDKVSMDVDSKRLLFDFYNQNCVQLAKNLLGKHLIRRVFDEESCRFRFLRGKIVETESYLGNEDKASHSFQGKRTPRNEPMFMQPGTAYVYPIYGMYHCFNISSQGEGAAVLLRAIEPIEGLDVMEKFRRAKRKKGGNFKPFQLCNGPSKLCQSFVIDKDNINKVDLTMNDKIWLEMGDSVADNHIVHCKRIGIDKVGKEWAECPLRFYVKENKAVSVIIKDKL